MSKLLKYFWIGLIAIGMIGVALAPFLLVVFTHGIIQSIGLALLLIEVVAFLGYVIENPY